jgi:pimeloyl-ACP methyl ester carboxylesterase
VKEPYELDATLRSTVVRRRSAALLIAFIAALSAHCSTATTAPVARTWPSWLAPCALPGGTESARCGTVTVAESPKPSSSRQIQIRVVVFPARVSTPLPDPVLMLVGGPGQGAADLAVGLSQRMPILRDDRDLLLIDQRGAGQSNGLHCQAPATAQELMGHLFDPARLTTCRNDLARRADLTRYTTSVAAADYPVVLDALGYKQVNIWGVSYGTRLGLELARRYPDRVRTLTLEGVAPPTFDWPTSGAPDAEAALNALIDDCAADADCSRAFPQFKQDVDTAFARLKRQRVMADVRDPATQTTARVSFGVTDLAYATRGLLYGGESMRLPRLYRAAADGDFAALAQAYVTRARTLDRQIARGLHLGIYCAEDLPFVDWPQARMAAAGTRMGTYLLDQYRRACDVWPRAPVQPSFRDRVQSAVPTLIMAGRRDPVTPPRTAEDTARTLSRARVLIWKHGAHGHDGLATPDCRAEIIRAFIATADTDHLPIDCMARDPVIRFPAPSSARPTTTTY